MALVSMRELLDHAATHNYAIPAFNVNNLEQVQAVMDRRRGESARRSSCRPAPAPASTPARHFIKHLIQAAVESLAAAFPLVMHQDHGQSPDICRGAMALGFGSVMMDGSAGSRWQDHRQLRVQRRSDPQSGRHGPQAQGVTVEGELGCLGSLETMKGDKEDGHGTDATMTREQLLTDPEEAGRFCEAARNWMRWRLPLAPATAPTSSPASPPATFWPSSRIKEIHKPASPTHIW